MKKKNFWILCAAAGLCIFSVLLLTQNMGIYAEKSGTSETEAALTGHEPDDALTTALAESKEGEAQSPENAALEKAAPLPEETLSAVWETLFANFIASGADDMDDDRRSMIEKLKAAQSQNSKNAANEALYEDTYLKDSPESGLSASEVGMIVLKEINRIYPKDPLGQLKISQLQIDSDLGFNQELYVEWTGSLDNGNDIFDKDYVSYSFSIDAVSGKFTRFGKFYPYQKDVDYASVSWTDEAILSHARELIASYNLADGTELDWSSLILLNGSKEAAALQKELEEEPETSTQIENCLIFVKDGKELFYFSMDWATGEVNFYIWPGRSTPSELPEHLERIYKESHP